MNWLRHVTVTSLAVLFYSLTGAFVWCGFFDTTPPVEILESREVSFDPASRVMLIEFEALKHRHCPGVRVGWLRDASPEPPPHVVVPLPEVVLPPETFRGVAAPKNSLIDWRIAVEVPPYLQGNDILYKAEWDFSCNFVQTLFPLRVQSPFIAAHLAG